MIDRLPLEFQPLAWWLRARVDLARADERGEVVPWVIIVAVMATLALAVGAIVVAKVMSKANGINLNGNGSSGG